MGVGMVTGLYVCLSSFLSYVFLIQAVYQSSFQIKIKYIHCEECTVQGEH